MENWFGEGGEETAQTVRKFLNKDDFFPEGQI